ncbi:hypothetical protein JCM3770_006949 [Rhodotorula araucariae]
MVTHDTGLPAVTPSVAAVVLPPSQTLVPPPSRPPGPEFDFTLTPDPRPLPPSLSAQLHTVALTDLDRRVTPTLVLEFLLVRRQTPFPRPLALKNQRCTSSLLLAFHSSAPALRAVALLNASAVLPLLKAPLRPSVAPYGAGQLAWGDLAPEVCKLWRTEGRLPEAEWVGEAPHPRAGVKVSEGYEREWRRVLAADREPRERSTDPAATSTQGSEGTSDGMGGGVTVVIDPPFPPPSLWGDAALPRPPIAFLRGLNVGASFATSARGGARSG